MAASGGDGGALAMAAAEPAKVTAGRLNTSVTPTARNQGHSPITASLRRVQRTSVLPAENAGSNVPFG